MQIIFNGSSRSEQNFQMEYIRGKSTVYAMDGKEYVSTHQPNALPNPRTMMIKSFHTVIAD